MRLASTLLLVALAVTATGCAKKNPCDVRGDTPQPGWPAHPELVPPGAVVCRVDGADRVTMVAEKEKNPFVMVVQTAEKAGWTRSHQSVADPKDLSLSIDKGSESYHVMIFDTGTWSLIEMARH